MPALNYFKFAFCQILILISFNGFAIEYTFVKGDTLWDLSISYLKDPYKWPQIKNMDGTSIREVRRIPIGHKVVIPNEIVKEEVIALSKSNEVAQKEDVINLSTDDLALIQNPYHYTYIYNISGLVRAYIDDKHVILPAKLLVQKIKEANPNIDIVNMGEGVAVSKDLIKRLLNIKEEVATNE